MTWNILRDEGDEHPSKLLPEILGQEKWNELDFSAKVAACAYCDSNRVPTSEEEKGYLLKFLDDEPWFLYDGARDEDDVVYQYLDETGVIDAMDKLYPFLSNHLNLKSLSDEWNMNGVTFEPIEYSDDDGEFDGVVTWEW